MERYLKDSLKGYGERWRKLAIFNPLFALKNKRKPNIAGNIDWFTLGLLTLLFFFECKVQRKKKQGYKELAAYLANLIVQDEALMQNEYNKIAHDLIDHFRNASGKKEVEVFTNWETGKEEEIQYNLLKTDSFELENNRQYFTLTEDGLALIFATKEYYSEFRISIGQLLIRKQLQTGQFSSALHEIHELRVAVQSIQEKIAQLAQEIARNIISDQISKKYLQIIDDSYEQLKLEDEQFRELYDFAKSSQLADFDSNVNKETMLQLAQVVLELSEVHQLHQGLLGAVMDLKNRALESSRQTLYLVGIDRFNFDQEIVSPIVSEPLNLEKVQVLAQPFLTLGLDRQWSLMAVLDKQRLLRREIKESDMDLYLENEEEREAENEQELKTQADNFSFLMRLILQEMGDQKERKLSEMNLPPFILENRSFYDFCILLHQESPITAKHSQHRLLQTAVELLQHQVLEVIEMENILELTARYSLQDMLFRKRVI